MVQITAKTVSNEQLEELNTRINEKYELENEVSDFRVLNNANTRLRDIVSPYIVPIIVSYLIILAYELIRFRKQGMIEILLTSLLPIAICAGVLVCIYAICRLPIGSEDLTIPLALYFIGTGVGIRKLIKNQETKSNSKEQEPVRVA